VHGATDHITPKEMVAGRQQEIHAERARKFQAAGDDWGWGDFEVADFRPESSLSYWLDYFLKSFFEKFVLAAHEIQALALCIRKLHDRSTSWSV